MRILHLISSGGYFGAENMLVNLAKGLTEIGRTCVVGVFENPGDGHIEVADRARRNQLPVVLIPCKGKLSWGAVKSLRSHIQNQKIDIVHTHGYKASVYGWLAARRRTIPLVATCHNWTRATLALRLYAYVDLFVLKQFQKVVAVSPDIIKTLQKAGISSDRVLMIPNGVDVSRSSVEAPAQLVDSTKRPEIVIGTVGRLVEAKGFQFLLQAMPTLLQTFPGLKIHIVGEGPFRGSLEQLTESLGIQSHVLFTGKQEDMGKVYSSMDIFVLPSLLEGMPMTILEAMAAGKPVVATSVGSIPQLLTSGDTGLLVEPGNVDSLRDALSRLLEDPSLRTALANKGRELVAQDYSIERMSRSYADLYETLH